MRPVHGCGCMVGAVRVSTEARPRTYDSTNSRESPMNAHQAARLASSRARRARQARGLHGRGRQPRHVVPRDARRRQRRTDPEGAGSDRLRLGLPRRHLRIVRARRQRRAPWARSRRHGVPAAHAALPDGETITVEPWRARAFPVLKDLVVDRSAFDRIIRPAASSPSTRDRPRGQGLPVARELAEKAMDVAQCIGCGACVAACKNASAALFTSAKVTHLALLPQGSRRAPRRVVAHGRPDGPRRLRHVLERGRVPGRLPEGNLDREHRADDPRVRSRAARRRLAATAGWCRRGAPPPASPSPAPAAASLRRRAS